MTTESCKFVVRYALEELNISVVEVKLGEVIVLENLTEDERNELNKKIGAVGLELIEKNNRIIIEKIKLAIIEYAFHAEEKPVLTLSAFLKERLSHSYGYLSNSFSKAESITIEFFLLRLRIERVKELIVFEEYTLSQIAFILHYSSVSHLSKQFKKMTGLTPTEFKNQVNKSRFSITEN